MKRNINKKSQQTQNYDSLFHIIGNNNNPQDSLANLNVKINQPVFDSLGNIGNIPQNVSKSSNKSKFSTKFNNNRKELKNKNAPKRNEEKSDIQSSLLGNNTTKIQNHSIFPFYEQLQNDTKRKTKSKEIRDKSKKNKSSKTISTLISTSDANTHDKKPTTRQRANRSKVTSKQQTSNKMPCHDSLFTLQNNIQNDDNEENKYHKVKIKAKNHQSVLAVLTDITNSNKIQSKNIRKKIVKKGKQIQNKKKIVQLDCSIDENTEAHIDVINNISLTLVETPPSKQDRNTSNRRIHSFLEEIEKESVDHDESRFSIPVRKTTAGTLDATPSPQAAYPFDDSIENDKNMIISSLQRQEINNKGLNNARLFTPREYSPNVNEMHNAMMMCTPTNNKHGNDRADKDLLHDIMNHPMQNISIYSKSSSVKKKEKPKRSIQVSFSPHVKVCPIPNNNDSFLSTEDSEIEIIDFTVGTLNNAKRVLSPKTIQFDNSPSLSQPEKKQSTRQTPKAIACQKLELRKPESQMQSISFTENDSHEIPKLSKRVLSPSSNPECNVSPSLIQCGKRQGIKNTPETIVQQKSAIEPHFHDESPIAKVDDKFSPIESCRSIPRVLKYDTMETNVSLNVECEMDNEGDTADDKDISIFCLDSKVRISSFKDHIQTQEMYDNFAEIDLGCATNQNSKPLFEMKSLVLDLEFATSPLRFQRSFADADYEKVDIKYDILEKDDENEIVQKNSNEVDFHENNNDIYDVEDSHYGESEPKMQIPVSDTRESSRKTKSVQRLNIRSKKKKKKKTKNLCCEKRNCIDSQDGACIESGIDLSMGVEQCIGNNVTLHSGNHELVNNSMHASDEQDAPNTSYRRSSRERKSVDRLTLKFRRHRLHRDKRKSKERKKESVNSSSEQNMQLAPRQKNSSNSYDRPLPREKKFEYSCANGNRQKDDQAKEASITNGFRTQTHEESKKIQKQSKLEDMRSRYIGLFNKSNNSSKLDQQQSLPTCDKQTRGQTMEENKYRRSSIAKTKKLKSKRGKRCQSKETYELPLFEEIACSDDISLSDASDNRKSEIQRVLSSSNGCRKSTRERKQTDRLTLKFRRKKLKNNKINFPRKHRSTSKKVHVEEIKKINNAVKDKDFSMSSINIEPREEDTSSFDCDEDYLAQNEQTVLSSSNGCRRSTRERKQTDRLTLKFRRQKLKKNKNDCYRKRRSASKKVHDEESQRINDAVKDKDFSITSISIEPREEDTARIDCDEDFSAQNEQIVLPSSNGCRRSTRERKQTDRLTLKIRRNKLKKNKNDCSRKCRPGSKKVHVEESQRINDAVSVDSDNQDNKDFSMSSISIEPSEKDTSRIDCDEDSLVQNENQWSQGQVENLFTAQSQVNPTSSKFWHEVAAFVPHKTAQQCHDQWFKSPYKKENKFNTKVPNIDDCGDSDEDDIFNSTPMRGLLCNFKSFSPSPIPKSPRGGNFICTQDDDQSIFSSKGYSPPITLVAQKGYIKRLKRRNRRTRIVPAAKRENKDRAKNFAEVAVGNNIIRGKLNADGNVQIDGIDGILEEELYFSPCSDDEDEEEDDF